MLKLCVIGNLGADAELKNFNGRDCVSFRVAHTHKFTKADGTLVETTTWVSCLLNGRAEKLLPYLRKGQKVYVDGDAELRVYSSAKTHQMEAGISISVRNVELCGSNAQSSQQAAEQQPDSEQTQTNTEDVPF